MDLVLAEEACDGAIVNCTSESGTDAAVSEGPTLIIITGSSGNGSIAVDIS
jgi:hypothetical protein